ncbi:hypothetical protein BH10PSE19_BH10PSE19_13080 [soil metagenome]
MRKLLANLSPLKILLLVLTILLPVYATAASDSQVATLTNQSKGADAYYLIQDKIWSENACVKPLGKKKVKPGQIAKFDIKKSCTWSAIGFKVFKSSNNEDAGYAVFSVRDGKTSLEIKAHCADGQCVFYDLNPQQQGRK